MFGHDVVARPPLRSCCGQLARLLQIILVRQTQLSLGLRDEGRGREEAVEEECAVSVRSVPPLVHFALVCKTRKQKKKNRAGECTHTSMPKPTTCNTVKGQTSRSQPTARLTTQMPSVRQVSIVLRVVALTRLVTLSPK